MSVISLDCKIFSSPEHASLPGSARQLSQLEHARVLQPGQAVQGTRAAGLRLSSGFSSPALSRFTPCSGLNILLKLRKKIGLLNRK